MDNTSPQIQPADGQPVIDNTTPEVNITGQNASQKFNPSESDYFDIWYTPGATVYKEITGKLEINQNFIAMTNESGEVFHLDRRDITNVKITPTWQLLIYTTGKRYIVSFMDIRKAAVKQQVFGIWSWGVGKDSFYSAENQRLGQLAVGSLEGKGYEVIRTSFKKSIFIAFAIIAVGTILLLILQKQI